MGCLRKSTEKANTSVQESIDEFLVRLKLNCGLKARIAGDINDALEIIQKEAAATREELRGWVEC